MTVVSVRVTSSTIGDLAPKSANTVWASITNESAGTPRAAAAGTRIRVPRMICPESRIPRGNATRRMLRADGTPPTASVESSAAAGGANTKVASGVPRAEGPAIVESGRFTCVPSESTTMCHRSSGPRSPLPIATLARESAEMRSPYATLPLSAKT